MYKDLRRELRRRLWNLEPSLLYSLLLGPSQAKWGPWIFENENGDGLFGDQDTARLRLYRFNHPITVRKGSTDNRFLRCLLRGYEYSWLKRLKAKRGGVSTIVDCGAYIGGFSLLCTKLFPKARIIAVEPDADNFRILQENVGDNPQISCVKAAIWPNDGRLAIRDIGEGEWGRTVIEDSDGDIEGIFIPSLMERFGIDHIDLMKLDIEGSELDLFEANPQTWIDRTDILSIETHERLRPGSNPVVRDTMAELGFHHVESEEDIIFFRDADSACFDDWTDTLARWKRRENAHLPPLV